MTCPGRFHNVRHNRVCEVLVGYLKAAGLSVLSEPKHQFPSTSLRPDIKVYNWSEGRNAFLDVTIVDQLQLDVLPRTVAKPMHVLNRAEKIKKDKYEVVCKDQNAQFIPLAFSAFGGFGKSSNSFLSEVAYCLATIQQRPYSDIMSEIRHRISSTIWSANMETVLNGPNHRKLVYSAS